MEDEAAARVRGQRCCALCAAGSFQEGASDYGRDMRICMEEKLSSVLKQLCREATHNLRASECPAVVNSLVHIRHQPCTCLVLKHP